jgi:hypothetical protein
MLKLQSHDISIAVGCSGEGEKVHFIKLCADLQMPPEINEQIYGMGRKFLEFFLMHQ